MPRKVAWAILKLVINTDLISFVQCLTDDNSLSYKTHLERNEEEEEGQVYQWPASCIQPSSTKPTPHTMWGELPEKVAQVTHPPLVQQGKQRLHEVHEQVHTEETQAAGPRAGEEQQGICRSGRKGSPLQNYSPCWWLTKRSHQEKVLSSLLSNHNRSTLFLKAAVPRATANHQGCSRLTRGWENHKLSVRHITQLNQDWVERQAGQQFTKNWQALTPAAARE